MADPEAGLRRDAVAARLQTLADLFVMAPRTGVDMSPEAVTRRLREMERMRRFCQQLAYIGMRAGLGPK